MNLPWHSGARASGYHQGRATGDLSMRSSHIASVPLLFVLAACVNGAGGSRASQGEQAGAASIPATQPTPPPVSAPAPAAPPAAAPRATAPAEVPAPTAASAAAAATPAPAPAPPRTSSAVPAARSGPPEAKPSTSTAKVTAPSAGPAASSAPGAGPVAAAPAARTASVAALDLKGLEQRLRDTHAIGVFTKLTLKNQVDDLLTEFKSFHQGRRGITLTQLRQQYEVLLLKVISLLQNDDPSLAGAVSSSRDAIWGVLTDPQKFANI